MRERHRLNLCAGPQRARAHSSDNRRRERNQALQIRASAHSFSSITVLGGDSLYLVGKVLGHRQSRTTDRYAPFDGAAEVTKVCLPAHL